LPQHCLFSDRRASAISQHHLYSRAQDRAAAIGLRRYEERGAHNFRGIALGSGDGVRISLGFIETGFAESHDKSGCSMARAIASGGVPISPVLWPV
jgi:hypothetical protein